MVAFFFAMVFHNGSYRITVRAPFTNFIMAAIIATVYGDYLATPKQFGIMRGNPKNEAFPGGWDLPAQIPSGLIDGLISSFAAFIAVVFAIIFCGSNVFGL